MCNPSFPVNQGELDAAKDRCEQALELAPDNAFVHWGEAFTLLQQGEREAAINTLETARELAKAQNQTGFLAEIERLLADLTGLTPTLQTSL